MTPDHSRGKHDRLVRQNTRLALSKWGDRLRATHLPALRACTREFGFAIESGDLLMLESGWYVTHGGLIRLAHRRHCAGIQVRPIAELSQPDLRRWVFQATIYKTSQCKGFAGFGDADPSNVSPLVRGAEMRVAETRAVNRALRKAYGVPLCSVEEVGAAESEDSRRNWNKVPPQPANGGNGRLQPRLRDRLCQLIRQHQLDPILVKSYALEFCGTKTLNEASREQIETFITHLSDCALKDKHALLCQLNCYLQPPRGGAA